MKMLIKDLKCVKNHDINEQINGLIEIGEEFLNTPFDKLTENQAARIVERCQTYRQQLISKNYPSSLAMRALFIMSPCLRLAEAEKSVALDNFIEIKGAGKTETRNYFMEFKKKSDGWVNDYVLDRQNSLIDGDIIPDYLIGHSKQNDGDLLCRICEKYINPENFTKHSEECRKGMLVFKSNQHMKEELGSLKQLEKIYKEKSETLPQLNLSQALNSSMKDIVAIQTVLGITTKAITKLNEIVNGKRKSKDNQLRDLNELERFCKTLIGSMFNDVKEEYNTLLGVYYNIFIVYIIKSCIIKSKW